MQQRHDPSTPVLSVTDLPWHAALRAALAGATFDYTRGSLNRAIFLLAVPMMLEMVMESLFAVVDIWFVAHLGQHAIATVGITESVLTLVYAVAIGLGMGATALVARRIGERDPDKASQTAFHAVIVALACGVLLGLPCALWGDHILALMGVSSVAIETGSTYTRLLLGSNVIILLLHVHNAIFRGAGDAVLAMKSLWLANLVNMVLDPCLIFGYGPFPELGLTGAALATTIGRSVGVAYQISILRRGVGRVRLADNAVTWDWGVARNLLNVSAGGIAQFFVATASWVFLFRITAHFGDHVVAGYTVGLRILLLTYLPAWGLSNAAATLVGQALGARNPQRAAHAVCLTAIYNCVFLGLVMALCLTMSHTLVNIFLGSGSSFAQLSADPHAAQAAAVDCLRILSYGLIFYALAMVLEQAFNGAGDTATPTKLNLICFWIIEIPLAYGLSRALNWGPQGVFWAVFISESLLALLALRMFSKGRWKTREV